LFKHKIIKYFLISALILFFLIFIAILRLSYKPLDITYFSNVYSTLQKQVSELYDFKSKKVFLELNVKVIKDWRKNTNQLKKLGYN
jgi:GTPase Era involved in 16S rRNA processing